VTCYICVEPGADTDDHIIPRAFFPPPRPGNLITLRAHYSCHNRLAEEYVRVILAGLSDASTAAQRLNTGAVARSLQRNDPLRADLFAGLIRRAEIRTPAGLIVGTAPAVRFDRDRFYPLMEKIVRGLYRHHTQRFLARDTMFNWAINEPLVGGKEDLFRQGVDGLSYPDVFDCRYGIAAQGTTEMTLWWLRFYRGVVLRCLTRVG
jgi:hypothetical protein